MTTHTPEHDRHDRSDQLLYTIADAAKRLGVGRTTFYGLLDAGHITTVNIGKRRLVPAEDLESYVERLRAAS